MIYYTFAIDLGITVYNQWTMGRMCCDIIPSLFRDKLGY